MTSSSSSAASTTTTASSSSSQRIMLMGTTHRRMRVEDRIRKRTSLMYRLPQTIVECIFQKLDHVSNRRLSLANRQCYQIAQSRLSSPIHISVQVDPSDGTSNLSNNISKLLSFTGFWKLSPQSLHIYSSNCGGSGVAQLNARPIEKISVQFPRLKHLRLRHTGIFSTCKAATITRLESLHVDWAILSPLGPTDFPMLTSLRIDTSAYIRKRQSIIEVAVSKMNSVVSSRDPVYFPPSLTQLHLTTIGGNHIDWNLFATLPLLKKWDIRSYNTLPMTVFSRLIGVWTSIEDIVLHAAIEEDVKKSDEEEVDLPIRDQFTSFVWRNQNNHTVPLRLIRWWNRCSTSLRKLDLTRCRLYHSENADRSRHIMEQIAACRSLTSLSLTDCGINDSFLGHVLRTCDAPLIQLCIRRPVNKDDLWMDQLPRFSKTLTHFDCRISSDRCPASSLFRLPNLEQIRNLSHIRQLGLCTSYDPVLFEHLTLFFPRLISLDLHGPLLYDIHDDHHLCLNIARFQSLTRLSVYAAERTASASAWATMIHRMPRLCSFSHRMGVNDPEGVNRTNVQHVQDIRTLIHPDRISTIAIYGDKSILDVPEESVE